MPSTYAALGFVLALLASLLSTSSAQFQNQSAPFQLKIFSQTNETLNNSSLFACHEGAAIEGLCHAGEFTTVPTAASTFRFNFSDSDQQESGYLTYLLQGFNFNVSEPLELVFKPSSNVALPLFTPSSTGQIIGFDSNDFLYIDDYVNDTVNPPVAGTSTPYYRWYVCTTYFSAYTYQTLSWVLGSFPPQNPSCQKVDVKRVYI